MLGNGNRFPFLIRINTMKVPKKSDWLTLYKLLHDTPKEFHFEVFKQWKICFGIVDREPKPGESNQLELSL